LIPIKRLANKTTPPVAWLLTASIAIASALQPRPAAAADCALKAPEDVVIALDVGHTAKNVGSTSARGIGEYDFNLKLAQRVRDELLSAGFRSTHLLVTELNGHAGLNQRAVRANSMNADIFISIHHDSVRDQFLHPWTDGGKDRRFFDESSGFSLHVSPRFPESLRLAKILADQLMGSGLHFTTAHELKNPVGAKVPWFDSTRGIYRRDWLVVLRNTNMPAVLLEAGVIANRDEELLVSTPAYQTMITKAVAEAVGKFCKPSETASYRIVNVTPEDVLNIRSGPNADVSVVGTIPAAGRGVQIVGACSGQWCEIDYRGARGWVNRQFLTSE
jgi:N-acetylmuramoyl-L-alanine amidase